MRPLGLLLLLLALPLGAEIVQIGNGSLLNQGLPWEAARNYSYAQQIYHSGEIGNLGYITSVAFQYSVAGTLFYQNNNAIRIWLGHTQRVQLDSFVPLDSLSLVWDGILQLEDFSGGVPGSGWLSVTLDQPFYYNSVDHLVLAVDENTPGSSSTSDEFLCTASPLARGIVFNSMSVDPDPAAPPTSGFYLRQAFPNLRLDLDVVNYFPAAPIPPNGATGVATDVSFQWQSDASSFELWLGDSPQTLQQVATNLSHAQWNPPEPLQMYQGYHWQVIGHQQGEDYPGPLWNFTTLGEGLSPPQNLGAWYAGDHVQLGWSPPQTGNPILYRIYRDGVFFASCAETAYQDFEVAPGQNHYYWVTAENALGEVSPPSNTVTVHIPDLIPDLILEQGFEACAPFTQIIPAWQNIDLDGSFTWTWDNADFPHEGEPLAWLSFYPGQTVPPLQSVSAHGGAAMLASLSATSPPNDDWLISPRLNLGTEPELRFWARSHTANYGLERLRVLLSVTTADPTSFTPLNAGNWISVPDAWTEYSFDLSSWQGQNVYLAWNCVSWDALALHLDDILVTGEGGYVALCDESAPAARFRLWPNPCRGCFSITSLAKEPYDLSLYDLRGRLLFRDRGLRVFHSAERDLALPSGLYLLRLDSAGGSQSLRLAVIK